MARGSVRLAALSCCLQFVLAGCGVYPVLIPSEATPPGTMVGGGFIAVGGRNQDRNVVLTVSPGVRDVGATARLGVLPGVDIGGRLSLFGGALADLRLQPLRRPVAVSFDIAGFTNHYHAAWLDPHVPQPVTYRGFRPSAMVGVGPVCGGVSCTRFNAWGPGMGVGAELRDTFDIRSAFAGVEVGTKLRLMVQGEVFKVKSRYANGYGFVLGLAAYSQPMRIWGSYGQE